MPNLLRRPSLSASFGSWCFSLVYNPRAPRRPLSSPSTEVENFALEEAVSGEAGSVSLARLLFPAYLASFVGVASACFALEGFVTLGHLTSYLFLILFLAAGLAFGSECASGSWSSFCRVMRWPLGLAMLGLALSLRLANILPLDNDGETNTIVAVFVGFVTVLTFLFVGAQSGGRTISILAPLVPCLSLFGLLCLISVDTRVQICFLIFLLASLYLLTYDRYLRRVYPRISVGLPHAAPIAPWPTRSKVSLWARQSLAISLLWFTAFFAGGMLLFIPVRLFLPQLMGNHMSKVRSAAQGLHLDFRGSGTAMELKGGSYALSDREILKVTVTQGQPSGLWRGRVFNYYNRSRWEEEAPVGEDYLRAVRPSFSNQYGRNKNWGWRAKNKFGSDRFGRFSSFQMRLWALQTAGAGLSKPQLAGSQGEVREVLEIVQPLQAGLSTIYSSGIPVSWQERPDLALEFDNSQSSADFEGISMSYMVRSFVVEPRFYSLSKTSGIDGKTSAGPRFRATLQLPENPDDRRLLSSIARQIELGTGGPHRLQTPDAKARAIATYLAQNCTYSLSSPQVPPTRDAVLYFLTESHQGACDMFASAMVLLMREMKVPARLVSGYLQSEDLPERNGERATYTLRERDAHAWVEYFVPGFGWLSYDPTQNTRTAEDTLPVQIAQWFDIPLIDIPTPLLYLPSFGLALLALGLTWQKREVKGVVGRDERDLTRQGIEDNYRACLRLLARKVPHQGHLTPGEYESRVHRAPISPVAKGEFAALTHLYNAARYGETPDVSIKEVQACARRFRAALQRK